MAYSSSIQVRSTGMATRTLSNVLQPMNPTSRFLWVQKPPYISPSSTEPASALVTRGKMPQRTKVRAPQRGL
jgi:hypothetical protein